MAHLFAVAELPRKGRLQPPVGVDDGRRKQEHSSCRHCRNHKSHVLMCAFVGSSESFSDLHTQLQSYFVHV